MQYRKYATREVETSFLGNTYSPICSTNLGENDRTNAGQVRNLAGYWENLENEVLEIISSKRKAYIN